MSETPTPAEWPRPFDAFLATINVANLTRTAKLMRVRDFIGARLRARHPGATDSDVRAMFVRRQREPFKGEAEWREFADGFGAWWAAQVSAVNRKNSGLDNIRGAAEAQAPENADKH